MRVAIGTSDYPVMGETFINRHIEHLFGGNTVVVCGRNGAESPFAKPIFARRGHARHWHDIAIGPFALMHNFAKHMTTRLPYGSVKRGLADFLRDQNVDLILAEFGTQALALAPLAGEMRIPIVSYFRGTDASKALRKPRMQRAYRRMFPHLAGVISVSQFLLSNLERHGITHTNAHVIPSGVDVRRFQPAAKEPLTCLAVGRLVAKKAPLITLQAFAEIIKDFPQAHLTLIGDGPLWEACQNFISQHDLAANVTMTGALPHEEVRRYLAKTALFLQHSITDAQGNTEGLPTAIQEAMSAGCITVATRHAGIPEAIEEGVTGFLTDEHDGVAFAQAIRAALGHSLEPQMGQAARAFACAHFDNTALLTRTEAVLTEAVERYHARALP